MRSNNGDIRRLEQKIALSEKVIERNPDEHNSYNLLASRYIELEELSGQDHSLKIRDSYNSAINNSDDIDHAIYQINLASYLCQKEQYNEALDILNNQVSPEYIVQLKDYPTNSQHLHARNVAQAIFNAREIKELINQRADLSDNLKLVLSKICDKQVAVKEIMGEGLYAEYAELINSFKEAHLSPGAIMVKLIKIDAIEKQANINSTKISVLETWKEEIGQKVIDNKDQIVEVLGKITSLDKDSITYARDLSKLRTENVEIYDLVFELQTQVDGHEDQLLEKVNDIRFREVLNEIQINKESILSVKQDLEGFRIEVTAKILSNYEMISSLFTKCQDIENDNEITQQDLSKLISEVDEHSTAIFDFGEDIDNINNISNTNIDPKVTEFISQYQDHSSTIGILISQMQMLKDSNISHEEKILNIRMKLKTIQKSDTIQDTTINMVSSISYDNELLNHPKIFNKLADIYGANKVLDLSSSISCSLIHDAIYDQNIDLLMGAIMSLDPDLVN